MVWYSRLLKNFSQFIVIHTFKGFGIVSKAEKDVFLELFYFFDDPADVGNLISGSSAFLLELKKIFSYILHLEVLRSSKHYSVQFSSVAQSCPTLCDPMNCSIPGLPVHHQLPEFTQTQVHRVGDAIQPSHPLSSTSPPALNPSHAGDQPGLIQGIRSGDGVGKGQETIA